MVGSGRDEGVGPCIIVSWSDGASRSRCLDGNGPGRQQEDGSAISAVVTAAKDRAPTREQSRFWADAESAA